MGNSGGGSFMLDLKEQVVLHRSVSLIMWCMEFNIIDKFIDQDSGKNMGSF